MLAKAEQNKMAFSGAWHKISEVGFSVQQDKFEMVLQLNSSGHGNNLGVPGTAKLGSGS